MADVSSFANARGGHIFFGIEGDNGMPVAIHGIPADDVDEALLRLGQQAADGIRERIPGLEFHAAPVDGGTRAVIVARVPASPLAPHMATYQNWQRYFGRGPAGKVVLSASDVRAIAAATVEVPRRAAALRADRLSRIARADTPVQLESRRALVVVHVLPHDALVDGSPSVDPAAIDRYPGLVPLWTMGGFDKTFDFEGYLSYYPAGERPRFSYLLVSRTGLLANGIRGTPNPYGPILLELDPEALTDCVDVAICLRSASGAGFDRVREALRNVAEVTRLFRWPGDPQILDRWGLQAAFPDQPPDQVRTAELSCAVRNGILSFEHLRLVRVDPYVILGTPLIQFVEQTARNSASPTRVFERDRFVADQRMVLEALGEALTDYPATLDDFADGSGTPLSAWAEAMRERGMYPAFCDYAGYLRRGTLLPVANATDVICEHRYAVALDDDICPECGELVY